MVIWSPANAVYTMAKPLNACISQYSSPASHPPTMQARKLGGGVLMPHCSDWAWTSLMSGSYGATASRPTLKKATQ